MLSLEKGKNLKHSLQTTTRFKFFPI